MTRFVSKISLLPYKGKVPMVYTSTAPFQYHYVVEWTGASSINNRLVESHMFESANEEEVCNAWNSFVKGVEKHE